VRKEDKKNMEKKRAVGNGKENCRDKGGIDILNTIIREERGEQTKSGKGR
jgi:hypothetical protein